MRAWSCLSLLRPCSAFDSTARVARSFATSVSCVPVRRRSLLTVRRSRALSFDSRVIAALRRRDRPIALRSSASAATGDIDRAVSTARTSRTFSFSFTASERFSAWRRARVSSVSARTRSAWSPRRLVTW